MKYLLLFCLAVGAFASINIEREGECPTDITNVDSTLYGMCNDECDIDSSCSDQLHKCCATNCGRRCVNPMRVTPVTEEEENKTRGEITEMLTTILSERRDLIKKLDMYPPPLARFIMMKNRTDVVRMCVTTPCELRKCQRIAQTMTYKVTPRKEWFCQLATTTEQCLFWAERGWTDTVMARENKIFVAVDKFNVTSFAYEKNKNAPTEIEKKVQNITLALTMSISNINTFHQLMGRKICSAGVNITSAFITPVCNLIYKDVMLATGDVVESSADFFGKMCVPGILNKTFDKNETYPEKLTTGCHNMETKYTGIEGSFKCIKSGHGEVMFVDSKVVKELNERYVNVFKLVCEDESLPLSEWEQTKCHLGYTPRPVLFLNPERNVTYKTELKEIILEAGKMKTPTVDLFNSSDYVCVKEAPKDLIFMDENTKLEFLEDPFSIPAVQEYMKVFNTCQALTPKPRAKICTTTPVQYQKCITMKKVFQTDIELRNISWGCVLARTEMDCMRNVLNGTADLYSGDVKEIFTAGNDFQLQPMMIQDENLRFQKSLFHNATVKSYTIAVMKKSKFWKKFGEDTKVVNIRNLTVCSPDIKSVPNFHLPIGHLLSTGVIPRIGSVFESVSRFYKSVCLPGAAPVDWTWDSDLILGHEVNWGIPGLSFYNFTGFDWFIWNSPHTWTFYNMNRKTPGTLKEFMKNRMLIPLLEGKLTVPEGFNPDTFDYSILDDVLSVEGLGDILNDIPDEIRDSLVDIRTKRVDRKEKFRELYEEKTGDAFVSLRDRRLGKLTLRGFLQQSFQNMEDEWGIFDDVNAPVLSSKSVGKGMTGGKVSNLRDILRGAATTADDNTVIGNLLKDYDSEYTVPVISRIFSKLLNERFETLDGLAKTLEILHRVPTMSSIRGTDYEWLKHPAVQSYLKIYAPRLISFYSDLYTNEELAKTQFSRYLNPIWLSPTFKDFLDVTKTHMTKLTEMCRGYGDRQGVGNSHEPFYGNEGALRCIEDTEEGDIAFIDTNNFATLSTTDYVMVTPLGIVQPINPESIKNGTFGTVPFPALMTAFNKTGTWRWNVTKALLIAQKKYPTNTTTDYTMYGVDSVFMPETKKMYPVPLNMQTHPTYLGSRLTRAFEAIIKPSTHDWWKERRHICSGESYTNVIEQRNGTCKAIVKDVTCGGMPRPKVISVGTTENKKPVVVRMCSRPTSFVREMAEFRCDNGYGYLKPVMVPTTCSCVPCDEIEYKPTWTTDIMWNTTEKNHIITESVETMMKLWGNEEFWTNHTLNSNFEIGVVNVTAMKNETEKLGPLTVLKSVGSCEANWYGNGWNTEWFVNTSRPVCLGTIPGLRRTLTAQRIQTKLMP
ncbi:major yolk protein-like [Apostichopus japonicus]